MKYINEDLYIINSKCKNCGKKHKFQKSFCIRVNKGYRLKTATRCKCGSSFDFIEIKDKEEIVEGKTYIIDSDTRERLRVNNKILCSQCGSDQIHAHKKGFGVGRALIGDLIAGLGIGVLYGLAGSNKIMVTCLKCGHKWKAGKKD